MCKQGDFRNPVTERQREENKKSNNIGMGLFLSWVFGEFS